MRFPLLQRCRFIEAVVVIDERRDEHHLVLIGFGRLYRAEGEGHDDERRRRWQMVASGDVDVQRRGARGFDLTMGYFGRGSHGALDVQPARTLTLKGFENIGHLAI